ncbi:carbonic anhydrase IV a precursor [Silurus meridionalis]|nr:carbonic anhydrase IV a precursor [Silurus meridionalis]
MTRLFLYYFLALVLKCCVSEGPVVWNEVNESCGGNRQSPINIVSKKTVQSSSLTEFRFTGYNEIFTSRLKNTGQTVSLDIPLGASVSGGNLSQTYNAVQLQFHWGNSGSPGSEHTIDGEQYPMELHIVHIKDTYISVEEALSDPKGQASLGFFFEESETENKEYSAFIEALAQVQDAESQADVLISLNNLILQQSKLKAYYRYEGSQTTPGCSESVIWTVFMQPIPLSKDQLAVFSSLKFKDGNPMVDNFRPVQPRKGRVVYRSNSGTTVAMINFTLVWLCVSTALSSYQIY